MARLSMPDWRGRILRSVVVRAGWSEEDVDPEAFVTRAYRELLGRPPDTDGLRTQVAALRDGASRTDILLALARSPEATSRRDGGHAPRATLPDLRRERPDRYRTAPTGHITFTARDAGDLAWLEERIHQGGYYDAGGVWSAELDDEKRRMAEVVVSLGGTRVLELGCYTGALLVAMAQRGLDVTGVELSRDAAERADPSVRDRIVVGDVVDDLPPGPFDTVVGLDIFEHVTPLRLEALVAAVAERVAPGGHVLANIPAFGDDDVFGEVFPRYLPSWEADAAAGRPFAELDCDELGYPRNGHLTWAQTSWWEATFTAAGLVRDRDLERSVQAAHGTWWAANVPARRSMYVFRRPLA